MPDASGSPGAVASANSERSPAVADDIGASKGSEDHRAGNPQPALPDRDRCVPLMPHLSGVVMSKYARPPMKPATTDHSATSKTRSPLPPRRSSAGRSARSSDDAEDDEQGVIVDLKRPEIEPPRRRRGNRRGRDRDVAEGSAHGGRRLTTSCPPGTRPGPSGARHITGQPSAPSPRAPESGSADSWAGKLGRRSRTSGANAHLVVCAPGPVVGHADVA